jgi:hypothetical protein
MGVNLQASTNLNRYMNLRGTGNLFDYTANNINVSGFSVSGKVNMATAGVSLDLFPFPSHGFRISPGMLFYNQNGISASATANQGESIKLNGTEFYAAANNPMTVNAGVGLNANKNAFTITTGWGNVIPRHRQDLLRSHLTFPFELGVAFTGAPTLNMSLLGVACTNQADVATNGPSCVNMATNTTAQTDLNNQLTTWRNDVNPYKVYPIFSFGVSYSFNIRPQE